MAEENSKAKESVEVSSSDISADPIVVKWEGMGFLEDIEELKKKPVAQTLEKLYLFIKDLDDNKRFNHGDLQELMDIGSAMFVEIIEEYPTYELNTDDLFRTFFNTKLKFMADNTLTKNYGEFAAYKFIRYYVIGDNGFQVKEVLGLDAEGTLAEMLTDYFKRAYVKKSEEL